MPCASTIVDTVGPEAAPPDETSASLDRHLFLIVSLILAVLGLLCISSLAVQVRTYMGAIGQMQNQAGTPQGTAAILDFTRALDAAIIKTSALFLGYLLVFTGALYVLRIATAQYQLNIKSGRNSGHLQTSSPGLVILTLGVVLVAIALLHQTSVQYAVSGGQPPKADSTQPNATQPAETHRIPVQDQPTLGGTAPPSQ
jgi:hypothetical protein